MAVPWRLTVDATHPSLGEGVTRSVTATGQSLVVAGRRLNAGFQRQRPLASELRACQGELIAALTARRSAQLGPATLAVTDEHVELRCQHPLGDRVVRVAGTHAPEPLFELFVGALELERVPATLDAVGTTLVLAGEVDGFAITQLSLEAPVDTPVRGVAIHALLWRAPEVCAAIGCGVSPDAAFADFARSTRPAGLAITSATADGLARIEVAPTQWTLLSMSVVLL